MEERSGHIHSMNTLVSITASSRLTKKKKIRKKTGKFGMLAVKPILQ